MERSSEMLPVAPGGATEGELIGERLWSAIEVLREQGLSKKAIARDLRLDIKTVRKWTAWAFFGEERTRIHIFTLVLGYSRRLFAKAYLSEGLEPLLNGHASAFAHFGGPHRDDPLRQPADDRHRPGRGGRQSGLELCVQVADQRLHGTTHEKPAERFARGETLIPVSGRAPSPREHIESRRVPRDAYVAVDANRYPVPLEWAGCKVEVHIQAEEIGISRPGSDAVRHRRLSGKHQLARWEGPPRPCPARFSPPAASGPPRFDPVYAESVGQVEARPLASYHGLVEEVRS
jgi:hypothetical protein